MSLDVTAQSKEEGLESRPNPQRRFLTHSLPLRCVKERGKRRMFVNKYSGIAGSHCCYTLLRLRCTGMASGNPQQKQVLRPKLMCSFKQAPLLCLVHLLCTITPDIKCLPMSCVHPNMSHVVSSQRTIASFVTLKQHDIPYMCQASKLHVGHP